ncbi:MAG: DUF4336 domain-containing protein [Phormidesmis sp.]
MRSEALQLYQPINTLKPVADNVWIIDGPIVYMDMAIAQTPFPTRMTVVRLNNGDLWCHSPIALTPALKETVDALGSVRHLISPNKIHYAYIGEWADAYPDAIAWASPGVRDRAAAQKIPVTFQADLAEQAPAEWAADIDQLIFKGSRFMDEVVFFHRASRTLILTDLIENFEREKVRDRSLRWLLTLAGNVDPDGKAPLDLRLTFLGNKAQARRSLKQLFQWQPEKIVLAHGHWYRTQGAAELKRAFRWLGEP